MEEVKFIECSYQRLKHLSTKIDSRPATFGEFADQLRTEYRVPRVYWLFSSGLYILEFNNIEEATEFKLRYL